jgi:hypothetical protein
MHVTGCGALCDSQLSTERKLVGSTVHMHVPDSGALCGTWSAIHMHVLGCGAFCGSLVLPYRKLVV